MEPNECSHAYVKWRNIGKERVQTCMLCNFELNRDPLKDYSGKALREIRAKKGVGRPIL